ncbi:MAG: glycyl-radical enzyme activating protein [Ruminococcus sp.]|nr:glycyl-radical enzyme activating protein [Ruminococcus sp.]
MLILNYQRMSTEDGPGLRTTLFVKGCPLKCRWCHNPESISPRKQIEWLQVRCMGCGTCIKTCPQGALSATPQGILVDRRKCVACGQCVENCPCGALECKGIEVTPEQALKELMKDAAYFGPDGGVTLSGGEILFQAQEAAKLLKLLKEQGIGTAVDTCGLTARSNLDLVFPYADIFLYDIKLIDSDRHEAYTGVKNELILDNFNYLAEKVKGTDKRIWVRTPIIPGATDTNENIRGIARFIKGKYERWEMCAFNNLCRDKYDRLYQEWFYSKTELMTDERMDELVRIAEEEGLVNVYRTGATRLKTAE